MREAPRLPPRQPAMERGGPEPPPPAAAAHQVPRLRSAAAGRGEVGVSPGSASPPVFAWLPSALLGPSWRDAGRG